MIRSLIAVVTTSDQPDRERHGRRDRSGPKPILVQRVARLRGGNANAMPSCFWLGFRKIRQQNPNSGSIRGRPERSRDCAEASQHRAKPHIRIPDVVRCERVCHRKKESWLQFSTSWRICRSAGTSLAEKSGESQRDSALEGSSWRRLEWPITQRIIAARNPTEI